MTKSRKKRNRFLRFKQKPPSPDLFRGKEAFTFWEDYTLRIILYLLECFIESVKLAVAVFATGVILKRFVMAVAPETVGEKAL